MNMLDNHNFWERRIKETANVNNSQYELDVFSRIEEAISGKEGWSLVKNATVRLNPRIRIDVDMVIFRNKFPYAVVEIKPLLIHSNLTNLKNRVIQYAEALYAPYAILCSPGELLVLKNGESFGGGVLNGWDAKTLKKLFEEWPQNIQIIKEENEIRIVKDWLDWLDKTEFHTRDAVRDYLQNHPIKIYEEDNSFSLEDEFERTFFLKLLGSNNDEKLCRYTSMASVFRTCSERKQSMCCLVCMNDKSEINYVQNKDEIFKNAIVGDNVNDYYILSCCREKAKDKFLMWRLYGDDARGVCIDYTINKELIDNVKFYLAPISYAQDKTQRHPELDFLKHILDTHVGHKRIMLRQLSVWQHFFKPFEYKEEEEVRLLYLGKRDKWILEGNYEIISPIVLFDVTEDNNVFPLVMNEIMLGPKSKEPEINMVQLSEMIKTEGIKTSVEQRAQLVTQTQISHYR